jgi:hypothetical protein
MKPVTVRGWAELLERLYAESWKPALGRFRSVGIAFPEKILFTALWKADHP